MSMYSSCSLFSFVTGTTSDFKITSEMQATTSPKTTTDVRSTTILSTTESATTHKRSTIDETTSTVMSSAASTTVSPKGTPKNSNPTSEPLTTQKTPANKSSQNILIPAVGGGAGGILLIFIISIFVYKLRRNNRSQDTDDAEIRDNNDKDYNNYIPRLSIGDNVYIGPGIEQSTNSDYAVVHKGPYGIDRSEKSEYAVVQKKHNGIDRPTNNEYAVVQKKTKWDSHNEDQYKDEMENQYNLLHYRGCPPDYNPSNIYDSSGSRDSYDPTYNTSTHSQKF